MGTFEIEKRKRPVAFGASVVSEHHKREPDKRNAADYQEIVIRRNPVEGEGHDHHSSRYYGVCLIVLSDIHSKASTFIHSVSR